MSPLREALVANLGQVLTPEVAAAIELASNKFALDRLGIQFHGGDDESGHVFAVETTAQAGQILQSHKHEHSHLSVLAAGVADVTIAGETQRRIGPCVLTIPKDTHHRVEAITDIAWYCLWAEDLAPKEQATKSLRLCTP
jgi:quercetin dioxygenase-like cupin family protein